MGEFVESPDFDFTRAFRRHYFFTNGVDDRGLEGVEFVLNHSPMREITLQSTEDIDEWRKGYWSSHQQSAKPSAVIQPRDATEVAIAVLLCRQTKVKFTVKSGGHAAMRGGSSSDNGLVIDLKNLDGVVLNEDKSIASIGAGNTWEPVSEELGRHGLAVAGGRTGTVGVGGYSLGGGISFFASSRGWACDNIRNYELVTADGQILNVNYKSYPDLYWALRGGGNNFGIVIRFDYETFPQEDIHAGSAVYEYKHHEEIVKRFAGCALNSDPRSTTWLGAAMHEGKGIFSILSMHSGTGSDSDVMKVYDGIPAAHDGRKDRSIADAVREIADIHVQNHRQNYWNHTFKYDADFISWLVATYYELIEPYVGKYETGQMACLLLQYITKESVSHMNREGGNCLPFKEDEAPYVNVLIPSAWKNEKDDELVIGFSRKYMDLAVEEGKRRGLFVEYVYMNYASLYQDVLKGYGEENYKKLKEVALKYDPEGVFQKLMPGYFKFGSSPARV